MTAVALLAIVLCAGLAVRLEFLQRRLRESEDANSVQRELVYSLREQLVAQADTFEWQERLLIQAVKAEFLAHQRWMRSGPHGDMLAWSSAKAELDARVAKLLLARGEMPTPEQMRAELRASLPPDQRPALRDSDITPVQGVAFGWKENG